MAKFIDRPDLEIPPPVFDTLPTAVKAALPSLRLQPDFGAAMDLKDEFEDRDIQLSVYEACEINRFLFEDQRRAGGGMKKLKEYWQALQPLAGTKTDDPEFMALIGALALDSHFRFDFAEGHVPLSGVGFALSSSEEDQLRNLMRSNGQADISAQTFERDSWSGLCLQIARPYPGWVHLNA